MSKCSESSLVSLKASLVIIALCNAPELSVRVKHVRHS